MLYIAIPTHGLITSETFLSCLSCIGRVTQGLQFAVVSGVYIDKNRNQVVEEFLKTEATHLLFVDSDIVFPPDGPDRLLAHGKPVVGGAYLSRKGQRMTVKGVAEEKLYNMDTYPEGLFQCGVVPTGFLLIERSVFTTISFPWFDSGYQQEEYVGEDVDFCVKCWQQNIPVFCDPTIPIGHVGNYTFYDPQIPVRVMRDDTLPPSPGEPH